jgi:hypothetical protein
MFVLLFYAFVFEHLGTGPQWSSVADKNAELCKANMWKNLLFIQNLYPTEEIVRFPYFSTFQTNLVLFLVRNSHISFSNRSPAIRLNTFIGLADLQTSKLRPRSLRCFACVFGSSEILISR